MKPPSPSKDLEAAVQAVLAAYDGLDDAVVSRLDGGLINDSYLVTAAGARWVLQRVNPIFPASIHANIAAVTNRLRERGLVTPSLLRTRSGSLCVENDQGVFRVMSFVEGTSFAVVQSAAQARAAGHLVGRFHAAVEGLSHDFVGMRAGVHDTPRHLARLREALATCRGHRLYGALSPLGEDILARAEGLPPLPVLPDRVCHGDLKLNNLMFAGPSVPDSERAVCLIDLDTVGPMSLAFELGDAWRSWCNRAGEDEEEAALDLPSFESSLDGYREGLGRPLSEREPEALLLGPEWVSLELAARFAADAVFESYFGWNPRRFAGRGEHNLVRARGQLSLHRALAGCRPHRAARIAG